MGIPEHNPHASTDPHDATEILGVVDAPGVAGGHMPDEAFWTLRFSLAAWKQFGQPLRKQELAVRKEVAKEEIDAVQALIDSYDVLRLRVRISKDFSEATLIEILGKDSSDHELAACARELQQPVTFDDSIFGTFSLDRAVDWFNAEVAWGEDRVRLSLGVDDSNSPKTALAHAHTIWKSQSEWSRRVTECAVSGLIQLKNKTWLDGDEEPLSAEQFRAKMKLNSITIEPDGSLAFWHNDGDLFWGHSIRVSATIKDGPTEAGIEG